MKFLETPIPGAYIVEIERLQDERGFFARSWCADDFRGMGLNANVMQCSVSFNERRGTLRGMHYQTPPHEETKLVRCTQGSIYDVIVDVRRKSAQFGQCFAIELNARNRTMLYVPEGVAHGFQTLEDDTEVFYQISERFHPEAAKGFRWNEGAFDIRWPLEVTLMSERDRTFPDFNL